MTFLPHDWRDTIPRADLEPYQLPKICQVPGCSRPAEAGEGHHVWRRSLGPSFREAWWVEIPESAGHDGGVYPNRVALCFEHHQMVTENLTMIAARVLEGRPQLLYIFLDRDPVEGCVLPPPVDMQLDIEGGETPHDEVCADHGVEETCSKCKGTGRVIRREREKREPARPKVTWSVRVPADRREDGHKVLDDLVEAVIDLFHEKGRIRDKNRGAAYYVLVESLAFVLQHEIDFNQPTEGE